MKNLRKLGAAVVLTAALALSAFAGETPTPPCAAPAPGQIETPPCSAAPGEMDTPGVTATAPGDTTAASNETSLTRIATDVLLNFLPLF